MKNREMTGKVFLELHEFSWCGGLENAPGSTNVDAHATRACNVDSRYPFSVTH